MADVSYSQGSTLIDSPQQMHEPSIVTVQIRILSFLRNRTNRNIADIHTRYGTKQYKIICPISLQEFCK